MEEAHEEDEASDGEDLGLDGMIKVGWALI